MVDVFVLDWVRTPRGKASPKGGLHDLSALDLVTRLQEALGKRTGLDPATVDDVILGVASQIDEQGADLARTANLLSGWPVPGVTLNRFCASGIDAVATAAAKVRAGDASLIVAGGVESVSRVPIFSDRGALWSDPDVVSRVGSVHMGIAADLNATLEGFTREQLDSYALETHKKAAAAWESGAFDRSVVPVNELQRDELIRADLSADTVASLQPVFADRPQDDALVLERFDAIDHLHTVATSPQMADAASLLLLGTADQAEALGLAPRARIVSNATATCDPVLMLTAGQDAMQKAMAKAGLQPADIDVFEFAEAFAALCLRFRRDLDAGPDRMNPNGGTIAMGHAFGATGAIMVGGCIDALEQRDGRFGVAGVSGAAGLGVGVVVERLAR
ncbi:MAG: acetyl-CoA C-acyltransferase [Candidatus Nanopelagicales bacterium]|nr:acetyl-CoA C-acyltransferase [Candidatus Nanopelagicales bacterium]